MFNNNKKGQGAIYFALMAVMGFVMFLLAIPLLAPIIGEGLANAGGLVQFVAYGIIPLIILLFIFVFYKLSQSG